MLGSPKPCGSLLSLVLYLLLPLFVILPPLLVLVSKRAAGTEKAIWFLVTVFLSWLGFISYLIATANRDGVKSGTS